MKIRLEPTALAEPEVIIRGDAASPEVAAILQALGRKSSGKLIFYRQEEQFPVDAADIVYLETDAAGVRAYTTQGIFEAKQKLYELKAALASFSFAQISKSTIVNINYVRSIQAEFSGNYRVTLKDRKQSLTVSRKYFKEFKEKI